MAERTSSRPAVEKAAALPATRFALAVGLAWLVPGLGHWFLRRRGRAAVFFAVVLTATVVGAWLNGNLYTPQGGQPLSLLATLGQAGLGIPYFVLRFVLRFEGDPSGPGFEYGTSFLLTAGLMNLLLVLDAWDIASGKKE